MLHYGAAGVMDVQQRQTTHFYLAPPVCVWGEGDMHLAGGCEGGVGKQLSLKTFAG